MLYAHSVHELALIIQEGEEIGALLAALFEGVKDESAVLTMVKAQVLGALDNDTAITLAVAKGSNLVYTTFFDRESTGAGGQFVDKLKQSRALVPVTQTSGRQMNVTPMGEGMRQFCTRAPCYF